MAVLQARSVSRPVWAWLSEPPFRGQVRAVFERTCLLETADGNLVALVLPRIGNGPLNVVVDGRPGGFSALRPGAPVRLQDGRLVAGPVAISIEGVALWEPRPDWQALRSRSAAITERLPLLQLLADRHAPESILLQRTGPVRCQAVIESTAKRSPPANPASPVATRGELQDALLATAREGARALLRGWAGDTAALKEGAGRLAGLGVGLTPAGDDFLAGLMLWAWLAHPGPRRLCQLVFEAAAARTTALSAAFLRAAAEGMCSEPWHDLLAALDGGRQDRLEAAVQKVLACGSTSGADTLAGFLLLATDPNGFPKPLGSRS